MEKRRDRSRSRDHSKTKKDKKKTRYVIQVKSLRRLHHPRETRAKVEEGVLHRVLAKVVSAKKSFQKTKSRSFQTEQR